MRTRHFHLLAAKASLLNGLVEDGYGQLAAYGQIRPSCAARDVHPRGLTERALDQVFMLSVDELVARHDERLLFEIRRLLFRQGNRFMGEGSPAQALQAYLECLRGGTDLNARVLEKFELLLDQLRSRNMLAEGALLCERALAGLYWRTGSQKQAEDVYKKTFGLDSLSPEAFKELSLKPEAAIIWNTDQAWHFLFRSDRACAFSGKIWAGRKIRDLETSNFEGSDSLKKSYSRVSFQVHTHRGLAKSIGLSVAGGRPDH